MSANKIAALAAALLAFSQARARAEEAPWSTPEITVASPETGVFQRIEASRRNYRDASRRVIENKAAIDMNTPGLTGKYEQFKKRIYAQSRLVTLYHKLSAEVRGRQDNFFLSDQTQVSKNDRGDVKGTLMREYSVTGQREGPAVRLLMSFEPFLMTRRHSFKIYQRDANGAWPQLAAGEGETLLEAMLAARAKLSQTREPAPLAEFILGLWAGSMQNAGAVDFMALLYPRISAGAESSLSPADLTLITSRLETGLQAAGESRGELARWRSLNRLLIAQRDRLGKAAQLAAASPRSAGEFSLALKSYLYAAQPLLDAPAGPAPSVVRNFQENADWIAASFRDLAAVKPRTREYRAAIDALPATWAAQQARQRGEMYLRSLYLLTMAREQRELDVLTRSLENTPGLSARFPRALRRLQQGLADNARSWRSEIAWRGEAVLHGAGLLAWLPLRWEAESSQAQGASPQNADIAGLAVAGPNPTYAMSGAGIEAGAKDIIFDGASDAGESSANVAALANLLPLLVPASAGAHPPIGGVALPPPKAAAAEPNIGGQNFDGAHIPTISNDKQP